MSRPVRPLLACTLFALLAGCAIVRPENRRTLNALDAHVIPDLAATRWVAAPVALPAALVAVAADVVIVHPCCVFDDAWGDTREWLWTPRNESRFRRAVMTPLCAFATPFTFLGDWLWRAMWDIEPREERDP